MRSLQTDQSFEDSLEGVEAEVEGGPNNQRIMDSSSSPILTLTGIVLVTTSLLTHHQSNISISNLFNEILISLNLTSSNLIVCRIDDRSLLSSDPRIRPSPSTIDDAVSVSSASPPSSNPTLTNSPQNDDDDAPQLQHEQQGDVDVSPPHMKIWIRNRFENQKEPEHINQLSHPTDDSITTNPVREESRWVEPYQKIAIPTVKPTSPHPQHLNHLYRLYIPLLNQPPRSTSTPGTVYVSSPSSAPSATSHYPDLSPPSQNESLQAMEPPKLNHRSRSSSLSASKYQKTSVPSTQLQQQGIIPSQYMDNSTYDSTARPISGYHSTHRFEPYIHQQQVQQQHLVHGWSHSQSTPHINTPSFIDPSKSFGHSHHHHHQPPLDPRKSFNWSPQHQHQQYQPLIIDAPPPPPKKSILKPTRTLHIDPPHRDLRKKKSVVSSDALFLSYASSSSPKPTVPGTGYGHILPAEPDASTEFGQYEVMQPLTPPDTPKGPFPFNRVSQGFVETVKVKHGRERSMDYGRGGYR
ncbi:hypothetical protein BC829DRAFT_487981 [Chytridium lagenaria]|nr:hypothetical protein BC829DRAFT_487981 [Chytridium lagenaria]